MSDTEDTPLSYQAAEALRKAGEYARAGKRFHELWNQHQTAGCGWRYAFCLRKAGYPEAALRVSNRVRRVHPEDRWVNLELQSDWYEARLKPAVASEDEQKVVEAARGLVSLGAEGFLLEAAVFAVVKVARGRGHWRLVSEWCDVLAAHELNHEAVRIQGRKVPSARERWYFAKCKALVHLESWIEARGMAEAALRDFPGHRDFTRWLAAALAGEGDLEGAAALLDQLTRRGVKDWYILYDLALYRLQLGLADQAWPLFLTALQSPGEDRTKVGLMDKMSQAAQQRGDTDLAALLLAWCMRLRADAGWPVGEALHRRRDSLPPPEMGWTMDAVRYRQAIRTRLRPVEVGSTPPREECGVVAALETDRPFAFIRTPDGNKVFVLVRDLPESVRIKGAAVLFERIASFDQKKQKASERAVRIRSRDV